MADLVAEFTVEPFEPSAPGPHVQAAIAAAQRDSDGLSCDVGPFGTTVVGPADAVLDRVREVSQAAFDNGATRVSLQISRA